MVKNIGSGINIGKAENMYKSRDKFMGQTSAYWYVYASPKTPSDESIQKWDTSDFWIQQELVTSH